MSLRRTALVGGAACALAVGALAPPSTAVPVEPVLVTADAETAPVTHSGDAADDMAIWVDPAEPANSLIIGNDKKGALEVYNLDGSLRQRITAAKPFWGNVDVRQSVTVGNRTLDLVAVTANGLRFYQVDPRTRLLRSIADGTGLLSAGGQGLCLYDSAVTGRVFAFTINNTGVVRQWEVRDIDRDGLLDIKRVRQFTVTTGAPPPEATEACVADDATGDLYVSEEEYGLWRYDAEPTGGSARRIVDRVQPTGRLVADIEGITLTSTTGGGQLIVSAQNVKSPTKSYFNVYDRVSNAYQGSFRIVGGAASDGCERTDGIAAYAGNLGPRFPRGVFICQDNTNTGPAPGNQNFKLTRLERVLP